MGRNRTKSRLPCQAPCYTFPPWSVPPIRHNREDCKMLRSIVRATALALPLFFLPTLGFAAGGSSSVAPTLSPGQEALSDYDSGLEHNERGRELLAEAVEADGKDREKLLAKARKSFEKAERELRSAISKKPDLFQAHSSLGFALRSMGQYEAALESYDQALAVEPRYGEAVEYRAEAYLHLDRLDEAKEAYLTLFRSDREHAAQLMEAMKRWVEDRRAGGGSIDPAVVDAFESWIQERSEASAQVGDLELEVARSW